MKENSIEEDMKMIENFINLSFLYGKLSFTKTQLYEYQQSIAHILSDYKRVLKENEELKEKIDEINKINFPILY